MLNTFTVSNTLVKLRDITERHTLGIRNGIVYKDQNKPSGKIDSSCGRIEKSVEIMYNEEDLSKCALFAGKFINFGYYTGNISNRISIDDRIESQKNIYRVMSRALQISPQDNVLEVGSGLGTGGVLVFNEFNPLTLSGIDFSQAQVDRSLKIHREAVLSSNNRLNYFHGSASDIPFDDNTFQKVYSIEAAQHFSDITKFFAEASRVLDDDGTLCVATFFGTDFSSEKKMGNLIQTIRDGIDHIPSITKVEEDLQQAGFRTITITAIGNRVWNGFDTWVAQQPDFSSSWTRNWKVGYDNGWIDYYLIYAKKS